MLLAERWGLGTPKERYRGLIAEGRARTEPGARPAGPRVAVLWPQTYMNDAGRSVGPARGALKVGLDRVVVVHDEIDIPFGEVRARAGRRTGGSQRSEVVRARAGRRRVRARAGRRRAPGLERSGDRLGIRARTLSRGPRQVRELVQRAADRVQGIVLGEDAA